MTPLTHTLLQLQGTFYGNNGWAGSCAGTVGGPWGAPGVWPPAGSYVNNMQPGNAVPINVALNRPQYSTSMCGKLLYVRSTPDSASCKTCGMTPISTQYILARVTNECPECAHGSLDLGIKGDGRSATHPLQYRHKNNSSYLLHVKQRLALHCLLLTFECPLQMEN